MKYITSLSTAVRTMLATLPFVALAASCSDDPEPFHPDLPATSGHHVRSITRLGSVESGYDWQFTYSGGRLTQAVGTLRDASVSIDRTFSYTSRLSFGARSVSMNNSSGEKVRIKLNARGYVQEMTVNRNVYRFEYNDAGRLSSWSKTAFEESLGQVQQYNSSATIGYTATGALSQITYNGTDSRRVLVGVENGTVANVNGILPPTLSREMGCLGFEQLYYAGLLGKAPSALVQSVTYSYPDAQPSVPDATTTFEYGYHLGNVTLCNYHVATGGVASVSYGY